MPAALEALTRCYEDRSAPAREWRAQGRPVIGYVGQDVPVELLTAAGALPVRLAGEPTIDIGVGVGDEYLGRGLDPAARSVLTRLLTGAFGDLDALVVSRDCEASLRLFYAVRQLRRIDPSMGLPPVHLVDLLHLPHRTTTRYNLARVSQLVDQLRSWTGRALTDDDIAEAVAVHNRSRTLLTEIAALRRGPISSLTGVHALAVIGAGTCLPVARYNELLERLLAQAGELAVADGIRTFVTGSSHDNGAVYASLEAAGLLIVGEDHDWGDLLYERTVDEPTLLGLAERYQYNGPTAQRGSIGERAEYTTMAAVRAHADLLVSYVRELDDAPPWDFPAQRTLFAASGGTAMLLDRQRYGSVDTTLLPTAVGTPTVSLRTDAMGALAR